MRRFSKRERRLVTGAAVFAGLFILVFGIILPFREASAEAQSDLEMQAQILDRSHKAVGKQAFYQQQLARIEAAEAGLEKRLLDSPSVNVAQTRLLELLNTLADQNDVTITRSSPVQERSEGEFAKVTLQINLECQITELTNFLEAIARHDKFLLVDEFSLNVGRTRRSQRNTLRPRIRVSGVIRLS